MQERANKFKPVSKKEVPPPPSMNQETSLTQESKLSSNSQNKLFIRKPVPKRNGFISPNFTKNRVSDNEEVKSPSDLLKGNKFIQSDSRSDQDYWQGKERTGFGAKFTLKKYITNQQLPKHQLSRNAHNPSTASEAYYGNESHALTQIGEHYKVQAIESDNSQKDLYSKQNMKKNSKQNIVANAFATKKLTRTQYFPNPNTDEVRSSTSRSLKEKQLNFNLLRHSLNNNLEAYVISLQNTIRKLQKNNYTIGKKCKWMHEEVQMHLEKEHLMTAEKKGFQLELKAKNQEIQILTQDKSNLQKQLAELKIQLQKKQTPKSYKSFKDLQTISSLKQLCKPSQTSFGKTSRLQQNPQTYFGMMPSSIDKSKKKTFRTYPGVCSPRKFRDQGSKSSSIVGNSESFQDCGQSSVLDEKSNVKSQLTDSKQSVISEDIQKQRDKLRVTVESMNLQIKLLKDKNLYKINQNNQELQQKLYQQQKNLQNMQSHNNALQSQKSILLIELDKIQQKKQTEIQALTLKIKDLQNQITLNSKPPFPSPDLNLEEQNPLKYFLKNSQIHQNYPQSQQAQNLDHQNKSLRLYIQKIIQHYKYMKIENRMLLKVKQDKEKIQKEKKQIKEERDSFKKKLLDLLKNNKNLAKQPTKSSKRLMDFGSDSSDEQDSAVFQLSQSEIKPHEQTRFEKVQN